MAGVARRNGKNQKPYQSKQVWTQRLQLNEGQPMRPMTVLLVAMVCLGILCGFAFGQGGSQYYYPQQAYAGYYGASGGSQGGYGGNGSSGGFGGYSAGSNGGYGGYSNGSQGGSYARYTPPAQYSYVPYSGNGYGYGSRWGSQPVYVLYYVQ